MLRKTSKNLSTKKTQQKNKQKIKLQTKFDLIDYNVNRNLSKNVFVENKKHVKKSIFVETKVD